MLRVDSAPNRRTALMLSLTALVLITGIVYAVQNQEIQRELKDLPLFKWADSNTPPPPPPPEDPDDRPWWVKAFDRN